jgi:hypothetical protein
MRRNHRTKEGAELGVELARLCDNAEPAARLKVPEILPRCASCAVRRGPHLANQSPVTLLNFTKCVLENIPFECHEPHRKGELCSGWAMLTLAKTDRESLKVPWGFR